MDEETMQFLSMSEHEETLALSALVVPPPPPLPPPPPQASKYNKWEDKRVRTVKAHVRTPPTTSDKQYEWSMLRMSEDSFTTLLGKMKQFQIPDTELNEAKSMEDRLKVG
eukprot:sb/3477277/